MDPKFSKYYFRVWQSLFLRYEWQLVRRSLDTKMNVADERECELEYNFLDCTIFLCVLPDVCSPDNAHILFIYCIQLSVKYTFRVPCSAPRVPAAIVAPPAMKLE